MFFKNSLIDSFDDFHCSYMCMKPKIPIFCEKNWLLDILCRIWNKILVLKWMVNIQFYVTCIITRCVIINHNLDYNKVNCYCLVPELKPVWRSEYLAELFQAPPAEFLWWVEAPLRMQSLYTVSNKVKKIFE